MSRTDDINRNIRNNKVWEQALMRIASEQSVSLKKVLKSPLEQDFRGIDAFTVPFRLACRARAGRYLAFCDLTIRMNPDARGKTEFDHIMDGNIDYYMLGYHNGEIITHWFMLDMDYVRASPGTYFDLVNVETTERNGHYDKFVASIRIEPDQQWVHAHGVHENVKEAA